MHYCTHFKTRLIAVLAALALLPACAAKPTNVLFIGNSLLYTGNLPSVFEALCTVSNKRCATEMIAEGGATLKQRVDDGAVDRALQERRFHHLVLQERGGDYIALPSQSQFQQDAEAAAENLSATARAQNVKPILLGTYQVHPVSSERLEAAERTLATRINVPVVSVSNRFLCGKDRFPDLQWLDADGMHPGPDLTLLMAVVVYREIFGGYPNVSAIMVHAPMYEARKGPRATSFASSQQVPTGAATSRTYDATTVHSAVEAARTCASDA